MCALEQGRLFKHGERLPLLLEPCHDRRGIHPELHDLQRHLLHEGLPALSQPDGAEAALAELRDEFEGSDLVASRVAGAGGAHVAGCVRHRHGAVACAARRQRGVAIRRIT
jgi:hypothetical protein